ncbi:REP-associated tyrosine transposase [Limnothrix redekei]|uniref:Transposase n=1 Tax=Limnothrix redekei LRLZ20PSL1 TaxID=3112953 RepID=A0ABW7CBR1_9CYAN
MHYRRAKTPGATYFFTLVTQNRHPLFHDPLNVDRLRAAFRYVMERHPFTIDGIVVLPDHLHCLWTLSQDDADYSTRWRLIKSHFSRNYPRLDTLSSIPSRTTKNERVIWQRRFWEHQIRDDQDFINHLDYIHYNPVRHQLVNAPKDWQYSSFHRFVTAGVYDVMWGASEEIAFSNNVGRE